MTLRPNVVVVQVQPAGGTAGLVIHHDVLHHVLEGDQRGRHDGGRGVFFCT